MLCGLCEQAHELRESHILPEFVYSHLYDTHHRFRGVDQRRLRTGKFIQKGFREKLLCDTCEQFLNNHFEKPFKEYWFDKFPLPPVIPAAGMFLHGIDYAMFKLFHLSVLFRCGIARQATYSEVCLGPHAQRLRALLQACDPGNADDYPVYGNPIVDRQYRPQWNVISKPMRCRLEGHTVYSILFGGCMWYYGVSSHRNPRLDKIALASDGTLGLVPRLLQDTAVILEAQRILESAP